MEAKYRLKISVRVPPLHSLVGAIASFSSGGHLEGASVGNL